MRYFSFFVPLAGLVASSYARKCHNLTVPVTVSSRNAVFNLKAPATNIEMTNFFLDWTQQGHNYSNQVLTGYATVAGTYHIAATFCTPSSGPGKTVQLLTHGVTLDRGYWDIPVQNYNYSYVKAAVDDYGFSTFSWDLVGIGGSQRGEAVNELQSNLQLATLSALTKALRSGSIPGVGRFAKVVHVGHSYGSIQTYSLSVLDPSASDALILTGFSQSGVGLTAFALGGNFVAASTRASLSSYAPGYLAFGTLTGVQTAFFGPGNFDPAMLEYAFAAGQPATVGEMLTLGTLEGEPSSFKGPVLVITGQRDLGFCDGDCLVTGNASIPSLPAITQSMIPGASPFEASVIPNAGHLINYEYTHAQAYKTILDFITKNVK